MAPARARVLEHDDAVPVLGVAHVGEPAAVGAPAGPEALQPPVEEEEPLVHAPDGAGLHVAEVDAHGLVREDRALAVRGPAQVVAEAGAQVGELALAAGAVGGAHAKLVFPAAIAEVGHLLAVRREGGKALGHAGGGREVEDVALFRRHREDLAAGLEDRALALGREVRVADQAAGVLLPGPEGGLVRGHLHLHFHQLLRGQLHAVEAPAGLQHEVQGADGGEVDVEVPEEGDLLEGPGLRVIGPDVVPLVLVAVGEEVEDLPEPHGLGVVGAPGAGQAAGGAPLQVEEPDLRGHAPAVALPGPEVRGDGQVGQGAAVRGEGPELAVGDGQRFGQAPLLGDLEEAAEAVPPRLHARGDEQGPAVREPAHHAVGHGVVGHAGGHTAGDGQDVDVLVAIVVAGEGDLPAVRGEAGEGLLPLGRREPVRQAPLLGDHPDVAGVGEGDPGGGHGGVAHQAGVDAPAGGLGLGGQGEEAGEGAQAAHGAPIEDGPSV